MKGPSSKIALNTWKNLMILGRRQGSVRLKDLSQEMGLGEEETLSFLKQVFPMGQGAEVYQEDQEYWIEINADAIQYMLPLSPSEWMELQQILDAVEPTNSVQSSLKSKLADNGPIKNMMNLLAELEAWDDQLNGHKQKLVEQLDEAILNKTQLNLITEEGRSYTILPCRVVHLEGEISLIAEDCQDHCLMVTSIKDVKEILLSELITEARVMEFEIEEFITAIRAMNEKETRLILKIYDPQSVNLFPDHQFLGKPCMITNPNGDLIWAAYVEACDPLYEWLLSMGESVEILDPTTFKQDYLRYCEEKIRKIA